jgi:CRISPR/Cas system CSM-associated protein Csm3 (group 7 of RAMP superfamily)
LRHECEKLAKGLGWQIFTSPSAEVLCSTEEQVEEQFKESYKISSYRGYHCFVFQIFGNPILPSRIIVDDLICTESADNLPSEVLRPGVTINRSRHTAEEKKLYFLEISPANAQLEFKGAIHLLYPDCPPYAKTLIIAALHQIYALGGSKSAGLGWLHWQKLPTIERNDASRSGLLPREIL